MSRTIIRLGHPGIFVRSHGLRILRHADRVRISGNSTAITPAILVRQTAQSFPPCSLYIRLQTFALDAGAAELERLATPGLTQDALQAAFDQRTQRDTFAISQLAGLAKQWVGNLDRRLHDRPISMHLYAGNNVGTHMTMVKRLAGRER